VSHGDGGVNRHLIRLAFHRLNGGEPLPNERSPGAGGVVLRGFPADARAPEMRSMNAAACCFLRSACSRVTCFAIHPEE
jgi:hypothetical protein